MPYGESRIVCREHEIQKIKNFVYGNPDDLRKQHSFCIYGYGGVGKTARAQGAAQNDGKKKQPMTEAPAQI